MEYEPLCPGLYRRLAQRFGSVKFAHPGEAPVLHKGVGVDGRDEIEPGEQYRVSCPSCGDTRHRLHIGHQVFRYPWMIYCYNEPLRCFTDQAERDRLLYQIFNGTIPSHLPVRAGREVRRAGPSELPGECVPLSALGEDHEAIYYLRWRGFDPLYLERRFGVSYCIQATRSEHLLARKRLIAPVWQNGVMGFWQGRFVGERNWKACPVPKYFDEPGGSKKMFLYNHDQAALWPIVVVCEGVTDVWRLGPPAVCPLGKHLSLYQQQLLVFPPFGPKPCVMLFDSEATDENELAARALSCAERGPVLALELPEGCDPGALDRMVLWDMIYAQASVQGVQLPELRPALLEDLQK